MKIVVQRVKEASVAVEGKIVWEISQGLLLLIGVDENDTQEDANWLIKKVVDLRIFSDSEGKMNLSVKDVAGEILCISQFTLISDYKKGNRPSYIKAAKPEVAIPLYETFIKQLETDLGKPVQTGQFGADMKVELINDGPVTIIIDSKNKEWVV